MIDDLLFVVDLLLVVDDDYDIASLKISLENMGLSVSFFTDPLLAIEEFRKKPSDYELVIRYRMPSMNGYEFVKQVKKINPKVNVIIMTAFEIEERSFTASCH